MAEWQPIETAPKDGSRIVIGAHVRDWGFVRGVGYWVDVRGIQGWVPTAAFSEVPGVLGLGHPTHWHPLSATPSPQETQ